MQLINNAGMINALNHVDNYHDYKKPRNVFFVLVRFPRFFANPENSVCPANVTPQPICAAAFASFVQHE